MSRVNMCVVSDIVRVRLLLLCSRMRILNSRTVVASGREEQSKWALGAETHPALEAVYVEAERAGGDVLGEERAAAVGRGAARREPLAEAARAHRLALVHQQTRLRLRLRLLGAAGGRVDAGAAERAAQVLRVPRALERQHAALHRRNESTRQAHERT